MTYELRNKHPKRLRRNVYFPRHTYKSMLECIKSLDKQNAKFVTWDVEGDVVMRKISCASGVSLYTARAVDLLNLIMQGERGEIVDALLALRPDVLK